MTFVKSPWQTLFDGCQILSATLEADRSIVLNFHYCTRFAQRLRSDAEREAKIKLTAANEAA